MALRQDTINVLNIQGGGTGGTTVTEALASLGLNVRTLPSNANLNSYGPTPEFIGTWSFATTGGTIANGFPENNAQGILEVLNGGPWFGTQRFTHRDGNIYTRTLTAAWNTTTMPWSSWNLAGYRPNSTFVEDCDLMNSAGAFPCRAATLNKPAGITQGGWLFVTDHVAGGNILQIYHTATNSSGQQDRRFTRTYNGTSWTPWKLLGGTDALNDLGYGTAPAAIKDPFDWQQADMVTGEKRLTTYTATAWTNTPAGITYNSGTNVDITCVINQANRLVLRLTSNAQTSGNRGEYVCTGTGAKGSRNWTVVQTYNSDSSTTVSLANGGTGASTAAAARTNLGLGTASTYNVGTSGNNIAVLNGSNTWSSSQTISANLFTVGSAATGNTYFKIGNLTQTASVLLDFRSSGLSNDYDARIQVTGGVQGTNGKGAFSIGADILNVTSASAVNFNSADLRAKSLLLTNALPVTSGGTGGNTPALARKGLELDETATDIDFRGAKVVTRETHASGIFASKPSSGGVNGGQIKSNCTINGVEVASAYLQMLKTVNSTDTTARLTVYQKGTGGVGGSEATKNFDFASNGNFYMDGTQYVGGVVATNIVANNSLSCGGSILANAGANVGVSPHNTNSNNGVRLWNSTSDVNEGQYVNTVGGGWYAGNWSLGAVRGGGTDLRSAQLNVSGGSGGGNASYMFKPNGVADGLQWNNISDRRKKKDIKTVENPIDKMKQFHGVTFTYLNGVPSAGYIAQDVQEVLPEVVTADHEGMLSMNVAGVGALHHEAILALIARVEELEKKIAELTSQ